MAPKRLVFLAQSSIIARFETTQTDRRTDRQTDERTNENTDRQTDGRTNNTV